MSAPQVVAVKGVAGQMSSVHIEADATPSASEAPADKGPSTRTNFDKRFQRIEHSLSSSDS